VVIHIYCVSMSTFWIKLLGQATMYGSDASYARGPSNQMA